MKAEQNVINERLNAHTEVIERLDHLYTFVDAVPEIYVILDDTRNVIYANKALQEYLKLDSRDLLLGKRPGELLNCIHHNELESGCGTTETCLTCGAFNSIVASLDGKNAINECRIEQLGSGDALDLKVWTTPYQIEDNKYVIMALTDISNEKRRQALERIFYHDVMNTAGGLNGIAQLLVDSPDEVEEYKEIILGLSERLIDEINSQRMLSNAESNELEANPMPINTLEFITDLMISYRKHYLASNKSLEIDSSSISIVLLSDKTMLRRVLFNMIKNAVEAAPKDSVITVGCNLNEDRVEFWVHNSSFMPREVQLQVFKRSFSTKGMGRGLGTYSMKLLSERYMNGSVSFTSSEDYGTVFTAKYPIET